MLTKTFELSNNLTGSDLSLRFDIGVGWLLGLPVHPGARLDVSSSVKPSLELIPFSVLFWAIVVDVVVDLSIITDNVEIFVVLCRWIQTVVVVKVVLVVVYRIVTGNLLQGGVKSALTYRRRCQPRRCIRTGRSHDDYSVLVLVSVSRHRDRYHSVIWMRNCTARCTHAGHATT